MESQKIGLKEAIQAAYEELFSAITEIPTHSELNFLYKTIDLEFTVEVTAKVGGRGGIKFWVLEAGADASQQHARTHVVRLSIEPQGTSGGPVTIMNRRELPPKP